MSPATGWRPCARRVQTPPDAAVIDIVLPRLDGCEVAEQLRAALGESVLLIAYTAYGPDELGWQLEDTDFDSWLIKPAEPANLRRCLARRHVRVDYSAAT